MTADWDDLRIFLALAREGKLTAVARLLDVSHPTVARRIKALERAIGTRLFDRLPDRFVLTAAGEGLLADAQAMEQAAEAIHRRSAGLGSDTTHGTVRISANECMAGFLAGHLPRLRRNLQCIEFELVASHTLANLSKREADLLIRERVPDLASLVTRKLGSAAHAIYGSRAASARPSREALRRMTWLGFDEEHGYMAGQDWLRGLLGSDRPVIRVNNWLVLRDAVRAGAGVTVLPCYLGDGDPALRRIGPVLDGVAADQWLLVHRDLRTLPRVRAVMDALVALFQDERAAFEGHGRARPTRAAIRTATPLLSG
jgi:DNA-binding transcriptional LysR family regulator